MGNSPSLIRPTSCIPLFPTSPLVYQSSVASGVRDSFHVCAPCTHALNQAQNTGNDAACNQVLNARAASSIVFILFKAKSTVEFRLDCGIRGSETRELCPALKSSSSKEITE
jgi:hypothetical protein